MKQNLVIAIILVFSTLCIARTIIVDANGTGDYPTIKAAIDDSNDGDIIELQTGVYTGDGNRSIVLWRKKIAIRSQSGPTNCIIDGEYLGKGFIFLEDSDSLIDGFTITRFNLYCEPCEPCTTSYGGAIDCDGSSDPTILNCIIYDNYAYFGGGIYTYSSPTIINCTITGNGANYGGGICCGPDTTIMNCIIRDNFNDEIDGSPEVLYSNVRGGFAGIGNIDVDPGFVDADANDYHLKFEAGRWDSVSQSWATDFDTSLCIDAGLPQCV